MRTRILSVTFVLALSACGSDFPLPADEACTATAGETHIAEADASPSGHSVMLHVVGSTCVVAGDNVLRLVPRKEGMTMHSEFRPQSDTMAAEHPMITGISLTMPSMGHGPAEEPVIDKDAHNTFTAAFQMPGAWRAEVTFYFHDMTDVAQKAVFDFTVH